MMADGYVRVEVRHPTGGRIMTKQSEAAACDINLIVRRWRVDGVLPQALKKPIYGDFNVGLDYHAAMSRVVAAGQDFEALPAHVRKHVDNDPGKFLDLVNDEKRRDEMIELGLLPELIPERVLPAPVVDPPPVPPADPDPEPPA